MNTQAIRDYVEGTTSIRNLSLAVLEIAAALDALDERTRPEGAKVVYERSPEVIIDAPSPSCGTEKDPAPAPSTIPGCYCRECKHAQFVDEGKYWTCALRGSPAYAVVSVPVAFGCVYGERREAE